MSSQKPKKRPILKVQVSFEASRVSNDCLASAYEQVVPVRSRTTLKDSQHSSKPIEPIRETQEETSLFDSLNFG